MSRKHAAAIAFVLLASSASAAQLDTNELARCAAMAVRDERLDCLDALVASVLPGATASPGAPTASVRQTAPPLAPEVAERTAPAARPGNPDDPANFGLPREKLDALPGGPGPIKSIVSQMTEDRLHAVTVVLDNGQTWVFIDPEPRLRPGDAVTVKRASLGSFLMTTPSRHGYRVERLK